MPGRFRHGGRLCSTFHMPEFLLGPVGAALENLQHGDPVLVFAVLFQESFS